MDPARIFSVSLFTTFLYFGETKERRQNLDRSEEFELTCAGRVAEEKKNISGVKQTSLTGSDLMLDAESVVHISPCGMISNASLDAALVKHIFLIYLNAEESQ